MAALSYSNDMSCTHS